jgi:hypothetical protein
MMGARARAAKDGKSSCVSCSGGAHGILGTLARMSPAAGVALAVASSPYLWTSNSMHHSLRVFLFCAIILPLLCQCTTSTTTLAPLIDSRGEIVFLAAKDSKAAMAKPSKVDSALEDFGAACSKSDAILGETKKLAPPGSGGENPKEALVGVLSRRMIVTTNDGKTLAGVLPSLWVQVRNVPPSEVDAVIPRLQKESYRLAGKYFVPVPFSQLKPQR